MAMNFQNPGSRLTTGNRYAQMLMNQPNANNGTTTGGLAHALRQGMAGYLMGKDKAKEDAMNESLAKYIKSALAGGGGKAPGGYRFPGQAPGGAQPSLDDVPLSFGSPAGPQQPIPEFSMGTPIDPVYADPAGVSDDPTVNQMIGGISAGDAMSGTMTPIEQELAPFRPQLEVPGMTNQDAAALTNMPQNGPPPALGNMPQNGPAPFAVGLQDAPQGAPQGAPGQGGMNLPPQTAQLVQALVAGGNPQAAVQVIMQEQARMQGVTAAKTARTQQLSDIDAANAHAIALRQTVPGIAPVAQWLPVTDADGNIVGQKNNLTGEVKKNPLGEVAGGPYEGTGLPAQNNNILLKGDPSSPLYAAAYNQAAQEKRYFDPASGVLVWSQKPDMTAFRKPTFAGHVVPPNSTGASNATTAASAAPTAASNATTAASAAPTAAPPPIRIRPEDQKSLNVRLASAAELVSSLQDYAKAYKAAGVGGKVMANIGLPSELASAWTNAAMMAKGEELFKLGVLAGEDMDLVRNVLPDPTTIRGAMASDETIDGVVQQLVNQVQVGLNAYSGQIGADPIDLLEYTLQSRGNQKPRSAADADALVWARANPDDPRSAEIFKRLGVDG